MRFFNRLSLSTPESVELEFTLAGIGNRTVALLIDYHIMGLLLGVFWLLWSVFSFGLISYLGQSTLNDASLPLWLLAIAGLISFAIFTGYFVFFEAIWQGQTPGKRFLKIRVIREDGRPIQLTQAVLRSLLRSIDDLFFIGAFFIIFHQREKRLGDIVAGTIVIQEERSPKQSPLAISEMGQNLALELPYMGHLDRLLPDDYAVVREYLLRRPTMEPQARSDLSLKLARQLRALMQLETIPANTSAEQFLEAVYVAYQRSFPDEKF
jgi:uncharacterized RDD family membrane protein YckC